MSNITLPTKQPKKIFIVEENGADIFLEKPFTKEQLYNSIKQLLN